MSRTYVATSKIPNAGRGVFASQDLKKGDVIEFAPILKVEGHREHVPTDLKNMVYRFEPHQYFVACGHASFYSHANPASAHYVINPNEQTITVIAARPISKNEEITISYCSSDGSNDCGVCGHTKPSGLVINEQGLWETPCGEMGG